MIAEHGFYQRPLGGAWQRLVDHTTHWQAPVRQTMQQSLAAVPGSLIEEKASGLAWHYRAALKAGKQEVVRLQARLEPIVQKEGLRLRPGKTHIEVQAMGTSKGEVLKPWLKQAKWDFILAAGDDVTDEDMFASLPDWAYTIKVGRAPTLAKFRQGSPRQMLSFLQHLI
jgi:trehalose 6-phosphate synthase/phosphatase